MNRFMYSVRRDTAADIVDHGVCSSTQKSRQQRFTLSACAAVIATLFSISAQAQQAQNLTLTSINIETLLKTVQQERTKLLEQEQQLKLQAQEVKKLNETLVNLMLQRTKLTGGDKTTQAQLTQLDLQIVSIQQQLQKLNGSEKDLPSLTEFKNKDRILERLKETQETREKEKTQKETLVQETKNPAPTLTPTKEKTAPAIETLQMTKEEMQQQDLKLKQLQEKTKQQIDPAQKKDLEHKQLEQTELLLVLQQKEKVTTEVQKQEIKTPAKILPNTEEKKGPVPTLTQTKEKTEPAIKQAQEVTPTPDELKLQQQIKKVREKLTELKNDPEQKKQLEQKLLELTKLQQQKLPEKTGPGTTLTQTEEKKGPATTTEMTREGFKELKAPPPNKLVGAFPMLPGDDMVAPLDAKTLKPVALPSSGSTFVPGGDISREDILAMLDKAGAQLVMPFDTQSQQIEQVLALFQVTGGNVGAAGAAAAGFAGLQTGALTMAALDVARQVAAASSSGDVGVGGPTPSFPYITAGSALPFSSWPTAMLASYVGRVSGTLNSGASIGGSINIVVNFTQLQSAGNPGAPGNITFDNGAGGMTFNLVRMGNYVGEGASGTYNGQAVTGYIMNGQFYGPQAQEIGGQWSMQNAGATVTAGGNFAAKQ